MNVLNLIFKDKNLKWDGWKCTYSTNAFSSSEWTPCPKNESATTKWANYMDGDWPTMFYVPEMYTRLLCYQHDNKVYTRGIYTKGKMNFGPGRIKVVARFNTGKATWPSIWMVNKNPEEGYYEIDIEENFVNNVYFEQTLHTQESLDGKCKTPKAYSLKKSGWNEFVCEFDENHVKIWVNDHLSLDVDNVKLPKEWFLILSMQYGWGKEDRSQLPLWMDIKSVEYFEKK